MCYYMLWLYENTDFYSVDFDDMIDKASEVQDEFDWLALARA